ncbi:hypothetical protein JT739_05160 [Tepidanaerobacter sp. GT38]|uniref:hypothetical protein n=1 Tax=Tepidanaerobacter sp. GT38 TaxID=2722793 RepID=UPI001F3FD9EC|nr:hypothetical protein [Tepidanaerobacter sp. GT38]MCG1011988.1 hypothetical protein [Tepidanaerobacter sp. GT38]
MLPGISKIFFLKKFFSVLIVGFAIKIMDDYIDQDIDVIKNEPNLYIALEYGGLPYALLLLSLAAVIDSDAAISLFLSSFAVGMVGNLTVKMPSGLYGFFESIIVILLGIILFKSEMLSSLFIMAAIQLWDDFLDYENDNMSKKNLAFLLGKVECLLLAIIFFLLTVFFDYVKAITSIIAMHIIIYIIKLLGNQR